ncbi:2-keto-4-pentenoate hydratase [Novosphingobium sp. YJ-S2-02]|uniref:2-keto-4-pentenoate hydratase n=1 Tax=Novosphingobium aureum TaxID=2792964 RepID=A0A931H9L0_9SPHN|nr:fumarylacetoacetate hydrolase family protein [Novosphingobium aureum]MBH0111890.1 2-keto-4-pentenoate hydratase [Novosphingobium aureum]
MTEAATLSADAFVRNRAARTGFTAFPGTMPETLEEAYAIQNAAIAAWPDAIVGWKVGRITGEAEARLGENRFVGPIFAQDVWPLAGDGTSAFPMIEGGFAALEAELVARIAAPGDARHWSAQDCAGLVTSWHAGIEVAGSPLATINALGPLASIAGFGNNLGLILGPRLPLENPDAVRVTTRIDDEDFGPREAGQLPGGPLAAIAYALEKLAMLGHEVPEGTLISTGAITGVHEVAPGQACRVHFTPEALLECLVTPR